MKTTRLNDQLGTKGSMPSPTPAMNDTAMAAGPARTVLEVYEEVKRIIEGRTLMLPAMEHLKVMYELYHLAVEEEIRLREELEELKSMVGDVYED